MVFHRCPKVDPLILHHPIRVPTVRGMGMGMGMGRWAKGGGGEGPSISRPGREEGREGGIGGLRRIVAPARLKRSKAVDLNKASIDS